MALGITHLIFGLLIGTGATVFLGNDPLIILFAVFGALFPDIDHPQSILGKHAKPIGWLSRHRGFFHSLIGAALLTGLIVIFLRFFGYFSTPYPAVFFAGYLSHLVLDLATKEGVEFFYPAKIRWSGKRKTGSVLEWVFNTVILVALLWYWTIIV